MVAQVDLHLQMATASARLLNFLAASLNVNKASLSQPSTSVMFNEHLDDDCISYFIFDHFYLL